MNQRFVCGDSGALVSYVYDECDGQERDAVAAHLAQCATCADEIEGLGWTRHQLGAWSAPAPDQGFQLPVPPLPWWRAPLPAWAQVAAAAVIFAAGLGVGAARDTARSGVVAGPPVAEAAVAAVSAADLAQLEQRLRTEMAAARPAVPAAPAAVPAGRSDAEIMRRVQTLVEESEQRQRRELTLRAVELARDIEAQRRVDLASVREQMGQIQGVTGAEIRSQREAIRRINDYFIQVSQQGR